MITRLTMILLLLIPCAVHPNAYHSITVDGDLAEWDVSGERFNSSTSGKNGYITWDAESLYVGFDGININDNSGWNQAVFVALDYDPHTSLTEGAGDSVLPYGEYSTGSTVHLPFNADLLYSAKAADYTPQKHVWIHDGTTWQEDGGGSTEDLRTEFSVVWNASSCEIAVPRSHQAHTSHIHMIIYAKDLASSSAPGWGWLYSGVPDNGVSDGAGDKTFVHYYGFQLSPETRPNDGIFYDAAQGHVMWSPDPPGPNDSLAVIIRDCTQSGWLHWGVNSNNGSWTTPIESYWPPGSSDSGSGSIETLLNGPNASDECIVTLGPFNSGEQLVRTTDFVIRWADDTWDNNNGSDYQVSLWFEPGPGEPQVDLVTPPPDTSFVQGALVNVSWTSIGATQTTLWLDGDSVAVASPYSWDTSLDSLGAHLLVIEAENASNLVSLDFAEIWVVPSVTEEEPPPGTIKGAHDNGDGTVTFALWAPSKRFVALVGDFNAWNGSAELMKVHQDSIWWTTIFLADGSYNYRYLVDGSLPIADPYGGEIDWTENGEQSGDWRLSEAVVHVGASAFPWSDGSWTPPTPEEMIIYETHLGDFSTSGDFSGLKARLPYLASLGINAIELLPCYEFPGAVSWGYNPAYYFAPEATYGTPEDLKSLVDTAHSYGIAILLDMVFNHLDASASLFRLYGDDYETSPWFHETTNPWGFPDIDHWSDGTKLLTEDVLEFWMDEYHFDGFRYDATAFIGWDGIGDNTGNGIGYFTYVAWDHQNSVYQVLEHLPQETEVVTGTKATSCWHDTFHDQMKANLREGSFEGSTYGNMGVTAQAIHYGGDGFDDESEVVNYTESHDEQRIIWEAQTNPSIDYNSAVEKSKLGAVMLMTSTGTPMIYHGQEFGEDSERTIDPNPLHWEYLEETVGASLFQYYKRLIWLRNSYPSLISGNLLTTHQDDSEHTISFWRWTDSNTDSVVVVVNFDASPKTFSVDFPVLGTWYEFLGDSTANVASLTRTLTIPGSEARIYCIRKRWMSEDAVPPAPPDTVTLSPSDETITITWTPVTTDSLGLTEQVSYYDVYRDTIPYFDAESSRFLATTNDTVHVDTSPPDGPVFYRVLAWDESGNRGLASPEEGRLEFLLGDRGSIQGSRGLKESAESW